MTNFNLVSFIRFGSSGPPTQVYSAEDPLERESESNQDTANLLGEDRREFIANT
jgi:hypothetical protein